MRKLILGILLHYANRSSMMICREQFFNVKKRILTRFGKFTDMYLQHISVSCHSCNGTGIYKGRRRDDIIQDGCFDCNCTGTYSEYWVYLEKYQLHKYNFFIPLTKVYVKPTIEFETITGKIYHKEPNYYIGRECLLWLFLIFDRKSFAKEFGAMRCIHKIRLPLVFLSNIKYHIREKGEFRWITTGKCGKTESDHLPF